MNRIIRTAVLTLGVALAATACGSDEPGGTAGDATSTAGQSLKGQTIEVAAVWTGEEQANFKKVLDAFAQQTGATVNYTPTGDNVATFLDSKLQGGAPPDVAMLPQQGVLVQFAEKGALKEATPDVSKVVDENFAGIWRELGSVDGKLYGVYFKAANKSTVWYRTAAFDEAGVQPPTNWDEFLKAAQTISDSGTTPVSIGGADGWTLTDWFENVYLSQAGPEMYDKLSKHEIPWTDPSVTKALETLGQLWGNTDLIAGGASGALQTEFPQSVSQTFGADPKAAMVYEGDFVAGVIAGETEAKVGTDAKFFKFPAVGADSPVVGGGDVAVAFKDNKAAMELMKFLASPDAAKIWAQAGGFVSPNKNLDTSAYPDDTTREIAQALIDAGDRFRFDMSDLAPAAFGGTKGAGEWKRLQDFLKNPKNVRATQQGLEADAKKAFG